MHGDTFLPGCSVSVTGLSSRPEFNGRLARVMGAMRNERYPVEFVDTNEQVLVRPHNLKARSTPLSLASLVQPAEAELFQDLAGCVSRGVRKLDDELMDSIRQAIEKAIGGEVILQVKGSIMKGTHVRGSDIDIVVDTPGRRVSRNDKEKVVESLKRCGQFHESHIKLKTLAIQCVVGHLLQEIEIIFSNTQEFGQLPNSNERFLNNLAAQHAARLLKISVKDTLSGRQLEGAKIPGFLLELLVLEVQQALEGQYELLADGSMQLFIAALQMLYDDGDALGNQHVKSQVL